MGAPAQLLLVLAAVAAALACAAAEPPQQERSALQAFLAGTPHERALGWNASVPACAWTGVRCDAANATVVELHLPGIGLIGSVPPGTLGGCRDSRSSRWATTHSMDAWRRRVGDGSDAAGAGRARQSGAEEGQKEESGMGWVGRSG